jgi:PPOX class probable F420-dependent enzyme
MLYFDVTELSLWMLSSAFLEDSLPHPKITPAVEEFLVEPQNLILATLRKDGRPQLSPVWFVWRDDALWISTTASTAKWKNLQRDQRSSGIIDNINGKYIYLSGTAEIFFEQEPLAITQSIVEKYKIPDEVEPYMDSHHEIGERAIIKLEPDNVVTRLLD